jgi:hypothetical protein
LHKSAGSVLPTIYTKFALNLDNLKNGAGISWPGTTPSFDAIWDEFSKQYQNKEIHQIKCLRCTFWCKFNA